MPANRSGGRSLTTHLGPERSSTGASVLAPDSSKGTSKHAAQAIRDLQLRTLNPDGSLITSWTAKPQLPSSSSYSARYRSGASPKFTRLPDPSQSPD
jgi:hypothetical protein